VARVLICGVKIPFVRGGQDVLVATLERELIRRGHEVDRLELPFTARPKAKLLKEMSLWRSIDVEEAGGQPVDLVIATKFPSYFIRHPRKSIWGVHQHREVYDLFLTDFCGFSDSTSDQELRSLIFAGDTAAIGESAFVSGISRTVVERMKRYNGIDGEVLYPPLPLGNTYQAGEYSNYLLSVARVCAIKRVDLAIKALPHIPAHMTLKVVGSLDDLPFIDHLKAVIHKHGLQDRVEFLGRVSDDELRRLYANAGAVFYAPHQEDYGYVTLEAFASSKPVITATDSGGTLEFVKDGETGLVGPPDPERLGHRINQVIGDKNLAATLGRAGRQHVEELGLLDSGWDHVIDRLLSPLETAEKSGR
jgi:glycosyltransferase involved in cell wall biosynthesis